MIVPLVPRPSVDMDVLAAFLNSEAADRAFRCISGSVAPSAYELESLPIPSPSALGDLTNAVRSKAPREGVELICH
jgi:adenine-specific DNA-methyltransferase